MGYTELCQLVSTYNISIQYRPYAIDIITQITKRETDGGWKFGYYTAILSGKNYVCTSRAPGSPVQEVILHLHPQCTRMHKISTGPNAH